MWNAEGDACAECKTCEYFLHEFWNCQGEKKPFIEYLPDFRKKQTEPPKEETE